MNNPSAKVPEAAPRVESPFGHGPRTWKDYLLYPRILFTLILCGLFVVLHIAFALYVWLYER